MAESIEYLRSNQWPKGTELQLLCVPWDASYRDVVAWADAAARDAWFEEQEATYPVYTNYNFLRPGEPVPVSIPYSTAYRYNYLTARNPAQPVDDEGPERTYYYFITSMTYLSPQAVQLTIQLDVMTTYAGEIELGRAFVDRGHIAMANTNAQGQSGAVLNEYLVMPEGLNIGQEYVPCARERIPIGSGGGDEQQPKIIIISTANLAADPGTISSPNLNVADGQMADGLPSGCNVYWVYADQFQDFMGEMQNRSWVAQCIVSIYSFPGRLLSAGPSVELFGNTGLTMHFLGETDSLTPDSEEYWACEDMFSQLAKGLGDSADLRKLYTYPYSVIELTDYNGNPVYIKPQLVDGSNLSIWWLGCALAPFARCGFFARNYGNPNGMEDLEYRYWGFASDYSGEAETHVIPGGDFIDSALWLSDFPQFSIVNNSYITYLASTARTRDYQYSSAGWSLDRSNLTATNAYNNAMLSADANYSQAYNNVEAGVKNANLSFWNNLIGSGLSAASGVAGAFTSGISGTAGNSRGGVVAGYGGIAQTTIGLASNLLSTELGYQQQTNSLTALANNATIARDTAYGIADNNYALAQSVAQGDYENNIAGIDAAVQDAALTPPSTVGQTGGNGFRWKVGLNDIYVTYKTLAGANLAAVSDYFRRYGYSIHRFMSLGTVHWMLCMTKFAYWKLAETNVQILYANETERDAVRGVFEKGVTLWATPEDIGTTSLTDNAPKAGYSY